VRHETVVPYAWNERMILRYPHGMEAVYVPRGRFVRPGDLVNGYLVDRFERVGEAVVAVLRYR
jgi:hypothetical protein